MTRPETYIGRDIPDDGVVVVCGVMVGVVGVDGVVGVVPTVPVPVDVPPPLACANNEQLKATVRKRTCAEFRINGTSV
jgi:hypothetical protein